MLAPFIRVAATPIRRPGASRFKAASLGWFDDPIDAREPNNPSPELYNEGARISLDLASGIAVHVTVAMDAPAHLALISCPIQNT